MSINILFPILLYIGIYIIKNIIMLDIIDNEYERIKLFISILFFFKIKYSIIIYNNTGVDNSFICSHILSFTGNMILVIKFGAFSYVKCARKESENIINILIILIFFIIIIYSILNFEENMSLVYKNP